MTQETADVLVIGGGVIGSAVAYHLARQGRRALVVERGAVASEPSASWASAGGIRRQDQHPAEAALAAAAAARWPGLEEELGADLAFRQGGHLLLAESDAEAEQLRAFVRRQREMGFADVELVDRRGALELAPGLAAQVVAGSFSPADGQADPALTTRAFAAAAERLGARYWEGVECLALAVEGGRVAGALTARGRVTAGETVLAAGAWSAPLAEGAGLHLPLRARALQALLSTPAAPGVLAPVLGAVGRALSLKQLRDGSFLLGGGWLGDLTGDGRSYTLRERSQQGNWAAACEIFPAVRRQRLARAWAGLQAQTLDDVPYIGRASALPGLTLAVGSWHGFGLAPAIGASVAELLAGRPAPELALLSPDRIARAGDAELAEFRAGPPAGDVA